MPELSVVLPCYNESGNLPGILERYRKLAGRLSLELILVDNGSTDQTAEVLSRELAKPENNFARSVRVEKNIGYGHGIQAGLENAGAPVVAFSHADLQCPPEDVGRAFDLYRTNRPSGPCFVMGRRIGARPWADKSVTTIYNRLAAVLLGVRTSEGNPADINAQPKVFDRKLITLLARGPKDFTYDLFALYVCVQRGIKLVPFEVTYESRQWGKSKLAANPWVRLKTSLNAFRRLLQLRGGSFPLP